MDVEAGGHTSGKCSVKKEPFGNITALTCQARRSCHVQYVCDGGPWGSSLRHVPLTSVWAPAVTMQKLKK